MKPTIIFFGSFGHYSAIVLKELIKSNLIDVIHVVTTPPFVNRKGKEEKGPVQTLAEENNIPFTTQMPLLFSDIGNGFKADFIITAGYGKLLPGKLLSEPKIASLNLHFSLLPKYRGANPGEWTILMGEEKSGITIIEMNEEFDKGGTIYQESIDLEKAETRESLYEKLYTLGGKSFPTVISKFQKGELTTIPQPNNDFPYASRFKRDDGFIEWDVIKDTMDGKSCKPNLSSKMLSKIISLQEINSIDAYFIEKVSRALYGFPSLWTIIPTAKGDKRMKIHSTKVENNKLVLNEVQIEGQSRARWNQVKNILN
ncbi:MAG: methionyl-tRNA formyltransferase [Candidatus Pacebacteria bacterium]|nr:methionyl-tRNA formyltransferase [Candidatus Paceibacterota bacterium]